MNNYIAKNFPKLKLSYETVIHKKVSNSQLITVIPKGRKCFLWFTNFNNQNCCLLIEEFKNRYSILKKINACYNSKLTYGTIFYGTFLVINKIQIFNIEDLFYYKGKNISNMNWNDKNAQLKTIFSKDLKNINYLKNSLNFTIPIMSSNINEIPSLISNLPYEIDCFQFKLLGKIQSYYSLPFSQFNNKNNLNLTPSNKIVPKMIFTVKPSLQNDIYNLYYKENGELTFLTIAYIPTYECSVMMNKLFRIIKENDNLDRLEESDDEEEFENESESKFVHLEKSYNMLCQFNNKFKKWIPIKIVENESKICSKKDLLMNKIPI
jgi:hypothetical protein